MAFVSINCCECGGVFGMNSGHYDTMKRTHNWFWCAICGQRQHFAKGESSYDRLRRERDRAVQQQEMYRQEAEAAKRQAAAHKGVVTKLKKRAAAGVCPCCNRTFENLHRHMQTKHPGFAVDAE